MKAQQCLYNPHKFRIANWENIRSNQYLLYPFIKKYIACSHASHSMTTLN